MARADLDRRICIIGAGAAGLSAAYFLRQRGYSRVVVLEASDRVGGKCCSTGLGGALVEAGALGATGSYREVLALARETGIQVVQPPDQFVFDERTREYLRLNTAFRKSLSPASVAALARYFLAALRHRSLRRPGFARVPAQLARPFSEWAEQRGMAALAPLLALPVTGFGYGALDATPAAYVLKYLHAENFLTLLRLA
jgi:monoamine oxidase